jgi:hypothetical protein
MNASQRAGSIEFLQFLADISNPATGEISAERLATWLCQTEADLHAQWRDRGVNVPWAIFADEILSILDAVQDQTRDLETTVDWYLHQPLDTFEKHTAQQLVTSGKARRLIMAIRAREVRIR